MASSKYLGDAYTMFSKAKAAVKAVALNLTEMEVKVEEATSNEPWGPHGGLMNEIAEAAYDSEKYKDIMGVIARRLQDKGEDWRKCYKSLLLLEHLIKNGPMKIVHELRSNINVIEALTHFTYKDAKGKDHGINVRNRAQTLVELTQDPERIKQEREKAKQNRNKYSGVSKSDMQGGGGSGGFSSSKSSQDRFDSYDKKFDSYDAYNSKPPPGKVKASDDFNTDQEFSSSKKDSGYDSYTPPQDDSFNTSAPKSFDNQPAQPLPVQKKKLSDTKVDPKIANAFAKMSVAAPAPAPALAAPAQAASGWDAFASATPAPAPPAAAAASANNGWDAFSSAPAPTAPVAASGGNDWDAFAAASSTAPHPVAASDPFAAMSAPTPMAAVDPFAAMSAPAVTSFSDPFAAMSAPTPAPVAASADPFGAMKAPSAAARAPMSAPLPDDLFGPSPTPTAFGFGPTGGMQPPQMGSMGMGGMQQPQMGGMMGSGMMHSQMGGLMGGMQQAPPAGMMGGIMHPQMGGMGMGGMQQPQMGVHQGNAPGHAPPMPKLGANPKKDPFADLSSF